MGKPNQPKNCLSPDIEANNLIGFLVDDILEQSFCSLSMCLESEVHKIGYRVVFMNAGNDTQKAKDSIDIFRRLSVKGYVISSSTAIEDEVKALQRDNFPVVMFDRSFEMINSYNVMVDNFNASRRATRFLVDKGCTEIGIVTLETDQKSFADRLGGYCKAMHDVGLLPIVLKMPGNSNKSCVDKKILKFLQENSEMEAIIFTKNSLTLSGMNAIKECCLSVPNDVAVVSFDDHDFFKFFTPSITTITQPAREISRAIVNKLKQIIEGSNMGIGTETINLEMELNIRESTEKPIDILYKENAIKRFSRHFPPDYFLSNSEPPIDFDATNES